MGIYYSLISNFSSPTEPTAPNVRMNSKLRKRRRRRHKRHHLLNQFFLGSKQFLVNTQPNTCLFHEYYHLNTRKESINPIQLHISFPDNHESTVIRPVQCTVAIRRDSLKLVHCQDDFYTIDFIFDADRPVQIYIYLMAHEVSTSNNGSLSYVCCNQLTDSDTVKRAYVFNRPAGHGQLFSLISDDIRFPLSLLNDDHHSCTVKTRVYPIVIVCRELTSEITKTIPEQIASFPTFNQYHIVLATIRSLRCNDTKLPITPDRVSILLLSQKHVYNGIVFKLFELYGIENSPSKFNSNDHRTRKKHSLVQIVPSIPTSESEPFLKHSNEINIVRKSSSELDLALNPASESTCVICLTDNRNVLLLPCRHFCLCGSCAENLKFQSANCPICRIPFRALLQIDTLYSRRHRLPDNCLQTREDEGDDDDDDDELMFENISLIDALNLSTTKSTHRNQQNITTNDIKYFCNEHSV
ncbi:unnamed protein product [Adineta ricciae]|uniref:RING-type domain-containing protein n=1 Tax=Adineta ricciae TaxID=249248 RepID=A0A813W8L2_ADIRI|nr:unnamed protein product [Adineta ricciae]CAF1317981.1 unnamed protein product [Adineta ricciae]